MAKLLTLEVTTPTGLALRTECEFVEAPSVEGEFGVFPGHLPVLAALKSGLLKYKTAGKVEVAALGPGFVEAEPDHVNVLSDLFAAPGDIDRAQAKADLDRVSKALADYKGDPGAEYEELRREEEWARARLMCLDHKK